VQLLADAAAAGRGIETVKISDAEAQATANIMNKGPAWFGGLPEFQALEAREGQKFELKT
jgi:hypothetical protein